MRAFVDQDLCIGCGMCNAACPEVFELNDLPIRLTAIATMS